jgi:microcin-processing metallopeptidase PmbA/TldD-like protein
VTADLPNRPDSARDFVAGAARELPADNPLVHVFFEERTDLRTTVNSSGYREAVTSRTRGVAVAGRRSVHRTDSDFKDLGGANPSDGNWVRLEHEVVAAGNAASAGIGRASWSAKLVSFHQDVWVGFPGQEVAKDVRRGCRLEVRAQLGDARRSHAVEELIVGADGSIHVADAFARAFERAEARRSLVAPPKPGSAVAVFAPGTAGVIAHELIGHALEGDAVARSLTWIRADVFPAAARPVTVLDDPRRGRGAWTIDDEGVAARETPLIVRGRPVGLLLDMNSASALGKVSTGHGRRSSYLEAVLPRMGCTYIATGDDDPLEVLQGTRRGVYIRRMTAAQTDPISGRASFLVTDADRIADGRLVEPLDVFVLELDGGESWRSIDRVCHDLAFDRCVGSCMRDGQPLAVSVGAPTIRIGVATIH